MATSSVTDRHSLFPQTVIAVVWDFDKTLIPGYMQYPLFRRFKIEEAGFWTENTREIESHKVSGLAISDDSYYLSHILRYVETGRMPKLNNRLLKELGSEIEFYPGIPEFFKDLQNMVLAEDDFRRHEIRVEHYIVSTGLRQMILGSAIAP